MCGGKGGGGLGAGVPSRIYKKGEWIMVNARPLPFVPAAWARGIGGIHIATIQNRTNSIFAASK